ncbi:uncharacterized protein LOC144153314 [Haemaphysalis longicornis]
MALAAGAEPQPSQLSAPSAEKDIEGRESTKSVVTAAPPPTPQPASYQYGYEVGSAPPTLLGAAGRDAALGRYVLKGTVPRPKQIEDTRTSSASAFKSALVSDAALRREQGRSSPVYYEPKSPEKEEESSLVTSYEIPRASAIPKTGAEVGSADTSQGASTLFTQPNKNERRIVITSKATLPITQRQQKRVSQGQTSEPASQEKPKSYHARTFPKAHRTPQYRPTSRPQYKLRTTAAPSAAAPAAPASPPTSSAVDYETKQLASTEQSPSSQGSSVSHQSTGLKPLTTEESYKQEQRSAAAYDTQARTGQKDNTKNLYQIRTPHSTQYMNIGTSSSAVGNAGDSTGYQQYPDKQQQQQQQQQAPQSAAGGYSSYGASAYETTTPVQSDQPHRSGDYATASQQDAYASQGYNSQDSRSVTVGATAHVSNYNQGSEQQKAKSNNDQYAYSQGTQQNANNDQYAYNRGTATENSGNNDKYAYHRGTAYPAHVSDTANQAPPSPSLSFKNGYATSDKGNTRHQSPHVPYQRNPYTSHTPSTQVSHPSRSQTAKTSSYDSRYQTTPKQPRPQTTLYKYNHGTYEQDRSTPAQSDDGHNSFSPINYNHHGNRGPVTESITTPSQHPVTSQPQQHYEQAHSLGKSSSGAKQTTPQYSKLLAPPLRNDPRATPKPDHQQASDQVPPPPSQPTQRPRDAQVLLVEINNPHGQQAHGQHLNNAGQQPRNLFPEQQRQLAELLGNPHKIPLVQQLQFLGGAAGQNQGLRVPFIEVGGPNLGAGNPHNHGLNLQELRQQIQQQLQQLNLQHQQQQQQQQQQQPFLFGQPQDPIQQMLRTHQLYVPQNQQGFHKIITQGHMPIELKVEPLFDANRGAEEGGGIKDVRIEALNPIPLQARPPGHGQSGNDVPYEVNMLVDAAKKALMSAGGFPKPEVIVVDGSQGGQMPHDVLRAVQQILNSNNRNNHGNANDNSGRQPKGAASSHHTQHKSQETHSFPQPESVKLNDKMNVQVAGLLVDSHSLQSVFPKNLLHGTGTSKVRYNEPVNVHIPVSDLPPRPAVDVRIRGPDGKVSQVLVPLHDANKLAALAKATGGNVPAAFPANLFHGGQHFGGGGPQGQKDSLLLGSSAQESSFGPLPGPMRLGEKVSLMDGSGVLQIADLPHFDPTALGGAEMIHLRHM